MRPSGSIHLTTLLLVALAFSAAHVAARTAPQLQELVMLCATEPGSPRFDATWLAWVEANPQADLDGMVADVVSRAGTLRSMTAPGMQPIRPDRRPSREAVADHMLRLGRSRLAELRREREQPAPG